MLIGIKYSNLMRVTGRPVTKGKNKMTTTTFKFNYKPNGRNPEIYRHVKVVGYYGSNDYKNLGMTVIVPERAYKNDKGFRRFDYDNIISMEVES